MMRPYSSAIELTMYEFEERPAHGTFAKQNYKVAGAALLVAVPMLPPTA